MNLEKLAEALDLKCKVLLGEAENLRGEGGMPRPPGGRHGQQARAVTSG